MIRAWVADDSGARAVEVAEAVERCKSGRGAVWLDLDEESEAAARALLEPMGIHPLAIEDMLMQINRPKVDDYGAYLYLAVHSARWDAGERPMLRELDLLVGSHYLVTYHDGPTRSVAAALEILPRRPELLARGPAYLVHFLLDVLVDNYLPIMERVSVDLDAIEEEVFDNAKRDAHQRILHLKRGLAALRRIVGPQRDTVLALTRDEYRAIPADMRPYLRDVYDRLARVGDLLDSYRDEIASLLELHVAIVSNQLNQVIKVLTVLATILVPLTVVTGYYGMNFKFAEYEWPHAAWYALGVLGATAFGTWWLLKRQRWL